MNGAGYSDAGVAAVRAHARRDRRGLPADSGPRRD